MTKEELEKEAKETYQKTDREFMDCQDEGEIFNLAYLAGAEPREKQIQIDAEQIRALQKQNGELTDKCNKLEAQIEKMKCCQNCSHLCGLCELGINGCYVCSKWEVRR